ncbi:helix-turn-helix domain-containing protein [Herbaspirillum sp. RV1423]|uniref:helix-turn-helix domain-containing protein n=1 Tax=Herbaspirillum sp. RV1423 TaxID=1443993 RepID=UPI00054CE585|nr:helix-turn-helix transcriptional regulator [Herbaspirillum sp. RV1423]
MKTPKTSISAREIFAQNLRRARRLKDISQEELALRAELSRTYVSEVERAMRNVSIDNMEQLAIAIGVPLRDLVSPDLFAPLEDRISSKK